MTLVEKVKLWTLPKTVKKAGFSRLNDKDRALKVSVRGYRWKNPPFYVTCQVPSGKDRAFKVNCMVNKL